MKTYIINHIEDKVNHFIWSKANLLDDFTSPWKRKPINKIEFKAVYDSKHLFFRFKVDDDQPFIYSSGNKNDTIANSDRVELFFRSNASLNPYYCLEIDSLGRIMDFKAYPNKKFDFSWNWPLKDIQVNAFTKENYFIVEITISIQSLKDLNLLKNGVIETGIYSAKYKQQKDTTYKPTWITWVNPNTNEPNFHTAASFGILKLEKFYK